MRARFQRRFTNKTFPCAIESLEGRLLFSFGALDASFGQGGLLRIDEGYTSDSADAVAVQSDGKILVGGSGVNANLIRLSATGAVDKTFQEAASISGISFTPHAINVQSDGKILIAGVGDNPADSSSALFVARLNTDGSFDSTFNNGSPAFAEFTDTSVSPPSNQINSTALAMAVQSDGKIVVTGQGYFDNTNDEAVTARFLANGKLDTAFGTGGEVITDWGFSGWATSLALQGDGKIVIGGYITDDSGDLEMTFARLNTDGSLDSAFGTGGKVIVPATTDPGQINAIAVLPSGKILGAGADYNGTVLVRLNSNGALDSSFGSGGYISRTLTGRLNVIQAMDVRGDGKIVVAAAANIFNSWNFVAAQFNADGSLDSSFGTGGVSDPQDFGGMTNNIPYALAIAPDGGVIVAGASGDNTDTDFGLAKFLDNAASANTASISGMVFNDANDNGKLDTGEMFMGGVTVYIDANSNGKLDSGEMTATTNEAGNYQFTGLAAGSYVIREVVPSGDGETTPLGYSGTVAVTGGQAATGPTFGNTPYSSVTMNFNYLVILARNYGKPGTFATGDLNGDGVVNFSDLVALARNYGHTLGAAAVLAASQAPNGST